jgi:hypothetical protein
VIGHGLDQVTSLSIGGVAAVPFTPVAGDPGTLQFTMPSGLRSGRLSLGSPHGSVLSPFDVAVLPAITDFSPHAAGPGDTITIQGTDLGDATELVLGACLAGPLTVTSENTVSATIVSCAFPMGGPVQLATPEGAATSSAWLQTSPPGISFTSPFLAPGDPLLIYASGLPAAPLRVDFGGGVSWPADVYNESAIYVRVPAGAANGPLTLETAYGNLTTSQPLYIAGSGPILLGYSPESGTVGSTVTIYGYNLGTATTVGFGGGVFATPTPSPYGIDAIVPAGAVSGPLTVITPQGTVSTATTCFPGGGIGPDGNPRPPSCIADFQVVAPPPMVTITGFSPQSGSEGDTVVISGTLLDTVYYVGFTPMRSASFVHNGDGTITATVPSGASTGVIQVCGSSGCPTSADAFVVAGSMGPNITGFSPTSGPMGTWVAISGTNLGSVTTANFGGNAPAPTQFGMDGKLYAQVPMNAQTGPVTVSGPVGSATSADSFVVQ